MKYLITLFICHLLCLSWAQQNSTQPYVEIEVSSFNVIEGETFALSVNIYNDKAKSPPLINTHPSLSIVASSHQFQQKNRQLIDSYIYQVTVKKPGIIQLPAIEVYTQKGGLIKTAPLKFIVHALNDVSWSQLKIDQQTLTYGTLLNASDQTPYIGQMASAHLKVLLPANINIEEFRELDIKFDNIASDPFAHQNAPLNSVNTVRVDDTKYQIYNFNTQFSCLNSEKARIGDGKLTVAVRAVNRSMGIFQTYTTIDLNFTLPYIDLQAQELPAGKPANFTGIIGEFDLSSSAALDNYKSYNDVINIVFNLKGEGNFNDTIIPEISDKTNWQVYPTQIVKSIQQNNYHDITFHQIIRSNEPQNYIPSYSFSYFNPRTGAYEVAQSEAIELPSLVTNSAVAFSDINTEKLTQPLGLLISPLGWQQLITNNLSDITKLILSISILFLVIYLIIISVIILRKRRQLKPYNQLKIQLLKSLKNSQTKESFYKNLLHYVDLYLQKNQMQELPSSLLLEQEQWLAYAYDKDSQALLDTKQAQTSIKLTLKAFTKSCKPVVASSKSKKPSQQTNSMLSLLITLSLLIASSMNSWSSAEKVAITGDGWGQAFELYEQDQPQKSLQLYQELIKAEQNNTDNLTILADLYFNLGVCYEKLQRIDLAHLAYRYSLNLQPSHPATLHNLNLLVKNQALTEPAIKSTWITALDTYAIWMIVVCLLLVIISFLHFIYSQKTTHKLISIITLSISCIILLGSSILCVYNYFYKENSFQLSSSSPSLAIIISATSADYFESASSKSTRLGRFGSGSMLHIQAKRQPYSLVQSFSEEENSLLNAGWVNNQFFCLIQEAPSILLEPFPKLSSDSPPANLSNPAS